MTSGKSAGRVFERAAESSCDVCHGFGMYEVADAENGPERSTFAFCDCDAGLQRYDLEEALAQDAAGEAGLEAALVELAVDDPLGFDDVPF